MSHNSRAMMLSCTVRLGTWTTTTRCGPRATSPSPPGTSWWGDHLVGFMPSNTIFWYSDKSGPQTESDTTPSQCRGHKPQNQESETRRCRYWWRFLYNVRTWTLLQTSHIIQRQKSCSLYYIHINSPALTPWLNWKTKKLKLCPGGTLS